MTAIEWTERTWNPVTGCDRISPGCAHCYARTMAKRLKAMGNPRYQLDGDGPGFGVQLHPDKLDEPLRRRRSTTYFVNSMSDLFHEEIPDEYICRVFDVMEEASQHTFQVLTKRPERALAWFRDPANGNAPNALEAPMPNVWIGVSIENTHYTWRADVLRKIPAAIRFISAEPLLGRLHPSERVMLDLPWFAPLDLTGIDWLIIGGESGPGARPMRLEWAEELLAACRASGVAPFVKQLGARPIAHDGQRLHLRDRKGGDPAEWPEHLRVREYPVLEDPQSSRTERPNHAG